MGVTINDIARQVGASNASVSRALRGDPSVSAAMREKIRKVAKETNYIPNILARGLKGGRTQTVGILWDLGAPQPSAEMVRGLSIRFQHGEQGKFFVHSAERLVYFSMLLGLPSP